MCIFKTRMIPVLASLIAVCVFFFVVQPVFADDGTTENIENDVELLSAPQEIPGDTEPIDDGTEETIAEEMETITRDSENTALNDDPYYTVGTVTYRFAKNCGSLDNCTQSDTPIGAALEDMESNNRTPSDRRLHFESGSSILENVEVNGSLNGIKGLTGFEGHGQQANDVVIGGTLTIHNMAAGFTVKNMTIADILSSNSIAIYAYDNKGTLTLTDVRVGATLRDSSDIVIRQTGNVVLNRVEAMLGGYQAANIQASGSVSILDSVFENNLQNAVSGDSEVDGGTLTRVALSVSVTGTAPVLLKGVLVQDNLGTGAAISAEKSTITITNSVFNGNDDELSNSFGSGLVVNGNIVLLENIDSYENELNGISAYANTSFTGTRVNAYSNGSRGLSVNTCLGWASGEMYCHNAGSGTVTIKNSAAYSNSGVDGFFVLAKGAITIIDAYAGDNQADGFHIDNQYSPSPIPVTLSRITSLGNAVGVEVFTKGAVTITNIVARDNDYDGFDIISRGTLPVTITINPAHLDVFNDTSYNHYNGYSIESKGPIVIIGLNSYNNGMLGGNIKNDEATAAMPVTLKVIDVKSTTSRYEENGTGGLMIYSRGTVSISNIAVVSNLGNGLNIENETPVGTAGAPVMVADSVFTGNTRGLYVSSDGLITLLNITAEDNRDDGVFLVNQFTGINAGISINAGAGLHNTFSDNDANGLKIQTNGPVTITNIKADDNNDFGLTIDDDGTAPISVLQVISASFAGNTFSGAQFESVSITANGNITVSLLDASGFEWRGIDITGGTGVVTVSGPAGRMGTISGDGLGLKISAYGNIVLTNLDISGNGGEGASLQNYSGTGTMTITNGYFDNNVYTGLYIKSGNSVTWKNGSASGNGDYGAQIINSITGVAGKPVTITNVSTNDNSSTGLDILSKGAVLLTNVESSNNSINGGYLENAVSYYDNLSKDQYWWLYGQNGYAFTVAVSSTFFNPTIYVTNDEGMLIASQEGTGGEAVLNLNPTADGKYYIHISTDDGVNGRYFILFYPDSDPESPDPIEDTAYGINIDNSEGLSTPVTITNTSQRSISNNSGSNINISSSCAVTVANADLYYSGDSGLSVINAYASTAAPVTLKNLNVVENHTPALEVYTRGNVILSNIVVVENYGSGVWIENNASGVISSVSLTNVHALNNSSTGIYILSNGAVTFNDVSSEGNTGEGIYLRTNGAVIFTKITADNNQGYGTEMVLGSSFTLNKPTTGYNSFSGNGDIGLSMFIAGKVTINKARANDNGLSGVIITSSNTLGTAPVSLVDVQTVSNVGFGTKISCSGAVTVTRMVTSDNGDTGLMINQAAPSSLFPILISYLTADGNIGDGVFVEGLGNITLSKFDASSNAGIGASLDNHNGSGSVTILNPTGVNDLNWADFNRGDYGVYIYSKGAVSVTGLETVSNAGGGLLVNNSGSTNSAPVTLNLITSRLNTWDGIEVISNGVVAINNSWSMGNGEDGIKISAAKSAVLSNTSSINNDWAGVRVSLSTPTGILTLKSSTWFGNLRDDSVSADKNLTLEMGTLLLL